MTHPTSPIWGSGNNYTKNEAIVETFRRLLYLSGLDDEHLPVTRRGPEATSKETEDAGPICELLDVGISSINKEEGEDDMSLLTKFFMTHNPVRPKRTQGTSKGGSELEREYLKPTPDEIVKAAITHNFFLSSNPPSSPPPTNDLTLTVPSIRSKVSSTFRSCVKTLHDPNTTSPSTEEVSSELERIGMESLSRLSTLMEHEKNVKSVNTVKGVKVEVQTQLVQVQDDSDFYLTSDYYDDYDDDGEEEEEDDDEGDVVIMDEEEIEELTEAAVDMLKRIEALEQAEEGRRASSLTKDVHSNSYPGKTYVHAYRVKVCNNTSDNIQLLGRNWVTKVRGGKGGGEEVVISSVRQPTNGVVGQFPVIGKGGFFEYTSGTSINVREGLMEGSIVVGKVGKDAEGKKVGEKRVEGFDGEGEDMIWEAAVSPVRLDGGSMGV